jgi:hypothetical protein
MLAAVAMGSCLTDLLPQLARYRGLLIGGFIAAAFMFTFCGRWIDATPNLLVQGIAIPVAILVSIIAGSLRIPRWSFAVLSLLVMVMAGFWFDPIKSWPAFEVLACTLILTPALIVGIFVGWVAARRGSRLQGDIAMAIFVGCAPFQCIELPRTAPQASTPHIAIKLDAKLLDACVGEYEMVPDNIYGTGAKVTIRRKGDHLVWQAFLENGLQRALGLYPKSETNFFRKSDGAQVTFIKNDKGEVMAVIRHLAGLPDGEGKKLKTE